MMMDRHRPGEEGDWIRGLDRAVADLYLEYGGRADFEHQLFIPGLKAIEELRRRGREIQRQLDRTVVASPETRAASNSVSNSMASAGPQETPIVAHLREALDTFDAKLTDDPAYPFRYLMGCAGRLNGLINLDRRPWEERQELFIESAHQVEAVLDAVIDLTKRVSSPSVLASVKGQWDAMIRSMEQVQATLADHGTSTALDISPDSVGAITGALGAARRRRPLLDSIEDTPQNSTEGEAGDGLGTISGLLYPELLERIYGLDLGSLKEIAEEEVQVVHDEVERIATSIDPDRTYTQILEEDLGPCRSKDEMFSMMRQYVDLARKHSLDLISLPDGEVCHVWPVPEMLQDSYPWGGYYGPDTFQGSLEGAVFLNQVNFESVTKGWLQMMAIHECYPGHHAHRVKTISGDLPLTMKLGGLQAKSSPLTEGIAHRAEEQLKDIFPDKEFPLFVAYRRLHTVVRIRAEMALFVEGKTVDEVVDLYVKYLGFTPTAARGQVRFQEMWPGYMNTYYSGYRKLTQLKKQLPLSDARFTEATFCHGYVSLQVLKSLLQLSQDQRREVFDPFTV